MFNMTINLIVFLSIGGKIIYVIGLKYGRILDNKMSKYDWYKSLKKKKIPDLDKIQPLDNHVNLTDAKVKNVNFCNFNKPITTIEVHEDSHGSEQPQDNSVMN
jgi:hypothetical protein